jgi:hypothetical protein
MATTTKPNTFLQRLIGAAALDTAIYEEVEADRAAVTQAAAIVLLSSFAAGIGASGANGPNAATVMSVGVMALLGWAAWALLTYVIGTQLLPQPQTRADVGELLRTLGFASTPGLLRVLGIMHGATIPAFAISEVWTLVATIVAVRQALDYTSTARAIAVCVLGWALALAMAAILGLYFTPPLY